MTQFDVSSLPHLASIASVEALPQEVVNIEDKVRSNLLRWNGQFSPQLIEALLSKYGSEHGLVLDPFAGSGTVLMESALLGYPCFGAELNPAAYILARFYTLCALSKRERWALLDEARTVLSLKRIAHFAEARPHAAAFVRSIPLGPLRIALETFFLLSETAKTAGKAKTIWERLAAIIVKLPHSRSISVCQSDARRLPLTEGSVGTVITSPPYINVFNYHQQYRKSVEELGWDVLSVARSEIGSNRKHRQNRFLTVVQYCLDMATCISEIARVCATSANIILIVGRESNVLGVPFSNSSIVAQLALHCRGLEVVSAQERFFTNRYGQRIYEDIIHIRRCKGDSSIDDVSARHIARAVLTTGAEAAKMDNRRFLDEALERLNVVAESETYGVAS